MDNVLEHHRIRTPGLVNPLLTGGVLLFHTTHATGWSMQFSKGGGGLGLLWIDYGDGSAPELKAAFQGFAHDYADSSDKIVRIWSPDGWSTLWSLWMNGHDNCGEMSGFSEITGLNDTFDCSYNALTGAFPSLAKSTGLQYLYANGNSFAGTLPSFAACTALLIASFADNSGITGTMPSFAACTLLQQFLATNVQWSVYVSGCFATQANLSLLTLNYCAFASDIYINSILADLRTSSALGGRVACTVDLSGGTNAAPTGQGIIDKAYLNLISGWSVTTN